MCEVERKYKESIVYYKVYSALINSVKFKKELHYSDIAKIMGIPETGNYMGAETGHLLGEISENEHNNHRPMLSAIVVSSSTRIPGDGFFVLAVNLGKLDSNATDVEKREFWRNERDATYSEWA